ncbi:hypothetical protein V7S43_014969 [Phytophthora oleae]|uniref:Uncharacterized protein n=1 Tax=Phytophthora oleae TaxID=2107226 RepID=A0ABD3EZQ3_9STRA
MTTQGNRKGLDELGQEALWSSRGQQVMMQWEKQYMETCVDALAILPTDRVLEIGFGLAYSATHIQTFNPKSHTIIECDQETLQRAQQFATGHSGVRIVAGTWQQQLPTLDQFDCIFFDDYPLPELEISAPPTGDGAGGGQRSRWHDFLDVAMRHCAAGARISGYLARELNMRRPGCQVTISRVQVDVPNHCNYFPHKTALVPVITVVDPVASAASTDEIPCLLPLPHASTKFQRAFERAQYMNAGFPQERRHITKIREFLLAHEMDALSYEQRDDTGDGSGTMDGIKLSPVTTAHEGRQDEEGGSIHYNDQESRQEFLRTLRNRTASKQTFG